MRSRAPRVPYALRVDAIDERIMELLRADGRAAYGRLGEQVGLSASAVNRRVDRLVADGTIQGFSIRSGRPPGATQIQAYVEIFCSGSCSTTTLRETLEAIPEIRRAGTVSGDADAIALVVAPTIAQLESAIERIREAPDVDRTVSSIVLTDLFDR
ncbi:putative transcriptional regulator, AsnC family protein [Cellulomonas gelida]|uniref:Putative transcriptional regulator, AsnC family protein n=1 Tax=Cellulomonas gelida TaxID=1712 RepID=A0A4Y3KRY9_9CELL|nr:putative transcriptional regulator, AsnC family protein [Cellulomonas gelida]GGL21706.1 putative transcriptional regulator, AsnC family protein [Cellulomonas gelida]